MKLLFDDFKINIHTKGQTYFNRHIVFLHGFTGSALDWESVFNFLPSYVYATAIDLPGHGESDCPKEIKLYTIDKICSVIDFVTEKLEMKDFALCGYSMGGRVALNYSIANPGKVAKLILESATPGIESQADQKARIASDNNLCDLIETNGINSFIDFWMNLELFDDLKKLDIYTYSKIVERKRKNSVVGLTNSLKGFGTGAMLPLWNKLCQINIPTLLITGTFDKKFTNINRRMNNLIINSKHEIFADCGHNVHTKKSKEFSDLLINFVK